jgi:pullulanase/glycogen debranching enzyme
MNVLITLLLAVFTTSTALAAEPPLSPVLRTVPGESPTPYLRYEAPVTTKVVQISGTWGMWSNRVALTKSDGLWQLDIRTLGLKPGRYEFKFISDKAWEHGRNRTFYLNDDGLLVRPPNLVVKALHQTQNEVHVYLREPVRNPEDVKVEFESGLEVERLEAAGGREGANERGYLITGNIITFLFDPALYNVLMKEDDQVGVAGNFNYWNSTGGQGHWLMHDRDHDGIYELAVTLDGMRLPAGESNILFRFVVNGSQWLDPPDDAINVLADENGNRNMLVDPLQTGSSILKIITRAPIPFDEIQYMKITGLADRAVWHHVSPGDALNSLVSDKPLGVTLNKPQQATTYRLFAPRASSVDLCIFDTPHFEVNEPEFKRLEPQERFPMWKDETDGVWEITLRGLDIGKYYSFQIDGPQGPGEGFNPHAYVSDPYGLAAAHAENNTIVIDSDATNEFFGGWTDDDWVTPAKEDMVIYEAHLRNLTIHPSSGVPEPLRGDYEGLLASLGTGTGLDHLKAMGVNMIELMPMQEFNNDEDGFNWGYTTVHYFAPEASYAREPLKGSQFYEFKNLVNELHNQGFGVILDVVYNHVGWPNLFQHIDRKYYFRLTPDYEYLNFSGVGNDFKSESPMARRFIVENIKYLVREFKIDGFRWDLAELIDIQTLMEAKREAEKINPNVVMISEPWSFRGNHKDQIRGTGWAAWNNDFRYAGRDFALGSADREWVKKIITGSTDIWAADPLQSVNYVESHDDMAIADVLASRPDKDGRYLTELDARRNRLAATLVFTSLGIPMINQGQEFMRSKRGISNTYNRGDEVNAIRWTDRDRPIANQTMQYYKGLIALRNSDQGRAFRVNTTPPDDYVQWIHGKSSERNLGYIVNAKHTHPGNAFIVLLNGQQRTEVFPVDLPAGNWRAISNGQEVNLDGLENSRTIQGPKQINIRIPGVRSVILMDGFTNTSN